MRVRVKWGQRSERVFDEGDYNVLGALIFDMLEVDQEGTMTCVVAEDDHGEKSDYEPPEVEAR